MNEQPNTTEKLKSFAASAASMTKKAAALARKQTERKKMTTVDLPQVHYSLGKEVETAELLPPNASTIQERIHALRDEISAINNKDYGPSGTFSEKAKRTAAVTADAAQKKLIEAKLASAFRRLGKSVDETGDSSFGSDEVMDRLRSLKERIATLDSEIEELSRESQGKWVTPKRVLLAATTGFAVLVLVSVFPNGNGTQREVTQKANESVNKAAIDSSLHLASETDNVDKSAANTSSQHTSEMEAEQLNVKTTASTWPSITKWNNTPIFFDENEEFHSTFPLFRLLANNNGTTDTGCVLTKDFFKQRKITVCKIMSLISPTPEVREELRREGSGTARPKITEIEISFSQVEDTNNKWEESGSTFITPVLEVGTKLGDVWHVNRGKLWQRHEFKSCREINGIPCIEIEVTFVERSGDKPNRNGARSSHFYAENYGLIFSSMGQKMFLHIAEPTVLSKLFPRFSVGDTASARQPEETAKAQNTKTSGTSGQGPPFVLEQDLVPPIVASDGWKITPLGRLWEQRIKYSCVTFSPDGNTLFAAGEVRQGFVGWKGIVLVVDARTGSTIVAMQELHSRQILDLSISPNENKFATSSRDGTVKVWAYPEPEQLSVFDLTHSFGDEYVSCNVQFSHNGKHLYFGGGLDSFPTRFGTLVAWDLATSKELFLCNGDTIGGQPNSVITGLAVLEKDERLVTSHMDGSIRSWNFDGTSRPNDSIVVPKNSGSEFRNGYPLIASSDSTLAVLNPRSSEGEQVLLLYDGHAHRKGFVIEQDSLPSWNKVLKFSTDGHMVASCGNGMTVWDANNGSVVAKLFSGEISNVAISAESKLIAVATGAYDNSGSVWVWRLEKN